MRVQATKFILSRDIVRVIRNIVTLNSRQLGDPRLPKQLRHARTLLKTRKRSTAGPGGSLLAQLIRLLQLVTDTRHSCRKQKRNRDPYSKPDRERPSIGWARWRSRWRSGGGGGRGRLLAG